MKQQLSNLLLLTLVLFLSASSIYGDILVTSYHLSLAACQQYDRQSSIPIGSTVLGVVYRSVANCQALERDCYFPTPNDWAEASACIGNIPANTETHTGFGVWKEYTDSMTCVNVKNVYNLKIGSCINIPDKGYYKADTSCNSLKKYSDRLCTSIISGNSINFKDVKNLCYTGGNTYYCELESGVQQTFISMLLIGLVIIKVALFL